MKHLIVVILFATSCSHSEKKVSDSIHKYPSEYLYHQRIEPVGIKNDQLLLGFEHIKKIKSSNNKHRSDWIQEGPTNVPGRIVDIEGTGAPENKIYACTASGGIFLTDNNGLSWAPIFDDQVTLSIGDLDIAPSNSSILYAGTGEANAGGGSLAYDGMGVFRSVDGGNTWSQRGLQDVGSIGRVAIHPTDPNIVYVAAMGSLFLSNSDRGIYKTEDGGLTWTNVLYISDITGGIDITIDPSTPEIVYAAMWERERSPATRDYGGPTSGIFKSINGGDDWSELTNGIPSADKGRIGIAISESEPDILYATIADPNGPLIGIYKTENGGQTWNQKSSNNITSVSFMWWFGRIAVHPRNSDLIYHIGIFSNKSTDGGDSWEQEFSTMHVDQHTVWTNPDDEDEIWLGNDGGVYLSTNGGDSFQSFNMPTTQFYTCEIDQLSPSNLYGGTQDNGTNRTLSGSADDYTRILGGDGFRVLVDYTDNSIIYAESQRGNVARSTNGGLSFVSARVGLGSEGFNWNTPIAMHPSNPDILYIGSSLLYKSTNKAANWVPISEDLSDGPYFGINNYGTITTIDVSNNDRVLAGTDDGNIWLKDENGTISQIYNANPKRWTTSVSFDPENDDIIYATFSGFRYGNGDSQVVMSFDAGETWIDIAGDLPDIPVNDLIKRPDGEEIIIATDIGVLVSDNQGENWLPLGQGLPNVVITDIDYDPTSLKLIAATYGRSLFSTTLEFFSSTVSEALELSIYPNPTTDFITIDSDISAKTYQIVGMDGRMTKQGRLLNNRISVEELPIGNYILMLIDNGIVSYKTQFTIN